MMEAIGQNAVKKLTDGAVTSTELGMESEDNGEKKIFDAALEQMQTTLPLYEIPIEELPLDEIPIEELSLDEIPIEELPLDERKLEELIADDDLSASLNSVILSQNQIDREITDEDLSIIDNSNMPLELIENELLSKDVSSLQTQVLKKATPLSAEMIEVLDPRFKVDISNNNIFLETGIAETGLQPLLQESTTELNVPLLQNVLQQGNSFENSAEIPVVAVQLEVTDELSTSNLQNILQKTSSESVLTIADPEYSQSDLPPNLVSNSKQVFQGNNLPAHDLNSILENQEEILQENLQTAFRKGSVVNSLDAEEITTNNILKFKRGNVLLTPEEIKAAESLRVVENFQLNEVLKVKEKFQDGQKLNAIERSQTSEKFQSGVNVNVNLTEGLQMSEKLQDRANVKLTEASETSEVFQVLKNPQDGARVKAVEGLQTSERIQSVEEFQGVEKTKLQAGFQVTESFKLAEEIQSEAKTKENFQMMGIKVQADVSENGSEKSLFQFRTLTSKDTQLFNSAKSSVDTVSPSGINSLTEVSGTTMVKGGESASTSITSLRGADLPFNMEQVVSRVRILRGNGVEEMTLRLHPEDLGQITLKIRQSGADLSIEMRVDNLQAKQMVESGFDSLRSKFLDQEFSYKELALNVDISERDSQFSRDQKKYIFEDDMNSVKKNKKEEIAEVEENPRVINRNDSGLNLYV